MPAAFEQHCLCRITSRLQASERLARVANQHMHTHAWDSCNRSGCAAMPYSFPELFLACTCRQLFEQGAGSGSITVLSLRRDITLQCFSQTAGSSSTAPPLRVRSTWPAPAPQRCSGSPPQSPVLPAVGRQRTAKGIAQRRGEGGSCVSSSSFTKRVAPKLRV